MLGAQRKKAGINTDLLNVPYLKIRQGGRSQRVALLDLHPQ